MLQVSRLYYVHCRFNDDGEGTWPEGMLWGRDCKCGRVQPLGWIALKPYIILEAMHLFLVANIALLLLVRHLLLLAWHLLKPGG